jgi:hypothetical protein
MTRNTYTGNGVTTDFTFSFPYLSQSHVLATINGVATTAFTFFSSSTLRFTTAPANGAAVVIYRSTPNSALLADFTAGSAIREQDLELDLQQNLYTSQELKTFVEQQSTAGLQEQITAATNTANTALTVANTQVTFTQSGTGAVSRSVASKLRDTVSLKDFGAVGNGITDDTAAVQAAEASAFDRIYVPEGIYPTTLTSFQAINKIYFGPGQLKFSGYAAAKSRSFITTPQPVPSTNRYQMFDAFNKVPESYYRFVGIAANPVTLPSTYTNYFEWSQRVGVYDFTAGFNTTTNDHAFGRSGAFVQADKLYHGGQGDLVARSFYGEVYSSKPGATHWLANPALIVENGNIGATAGAAPGCYLNHSEYIYSDAGNAVACIDRVRNYVRTNSGNSLSQVWIHDRPQVAGSQPIDSVYSIAGSTKVGLDFTPATLTANKAAIALKAGDRIYFEASATPDPLGALWYADTLGGTYMTSFTGGYLTLYSNNNPSLQVHQSEVFVQTANGLTLNNTGIIKFSGTGQYSTGSSTASFAATNKPGGTSGAGPATWIKVICGSTAYLIPGWIF